MKLLKKRTVFIAKTLSFSFFTAMLWAVCVTHAFAATIYVNSSAGNDTTGDGTSGLPYKTFHKAYTMASANDTLHLTGTFTWTDADETGDATTNGYTLSKHLTLQGAGINETILQAHTAEAQADRRVFTVATNTNVDFKNLSIRHGRITTSTTYGGGIYINATSTVNIIDSVIYKSRSTYFGGGVANYGTLTIASSTIYDNVGPNGGGGIVSISKGDSLIITNSTIYNNYITATTGNFEGGGVYVALGNANFTNVTITRNRAVSGPAGYSMNDPAGYLTISNTIIAGNTGGSASEFGYRQASYGNVIDNGHNIIAGNNSYYTWVNTTTWRDVNRTGVFTRIGSSATGTLNLDDALSSNDAGNKVPTIALLSGSVAINNGTTTANATSSIPSLDQRGASRVGQVDIGAFEYNGTGLNIAAPTVQASNITASSSVLYNQMTFSWDVGNGARRVVFMKEGSSGTTSPANGTYYTASSTFGGGTQINTSGWYSVYEGLGTSTTVYGLASSTEYRIQVFEYNGIADGASEYFTNTATNNPQTIETYTPITIYCNYASGNDSTGDGTSGAPYKTFNKCYTMANSGDVLNISGTFDWSNDDETGDAVTTGYNFVRKDLTIQGQGAGTTYIQATSTMNTATRRVFTFASSTVVMNGVTVRYGKVTGGSDYGGGISTNSDLTINDSEFSFSTTTQGIGGALYGTGSLLSINNSSIYDNHAYYGGGGVSFNNTNGNLNIKNTSIYGNRISATTGNFEGGGVYLAQGDGNFTNVTITYNKSAAGPSGYSMNDPQGYLTIKNTIIAGNVGGSSAEFGYRQASYGNVIDNGHNIISGANTYYTWASATTWRDISRTGAFTRIGDSATGTLRIASTSPGINGAMNNTNTMALLVGSIAINTGSTTANGSVAIPSTDQRGATRNGNTDIGAYEYEGGNLVDVTAPSISSIASSTATSTATITWSTNEAASSTLRYGATASYGTVTSSTTLATSHSYALSGLNPSTTYHFQIMVSDSAGNIATSSDTTFTTTALPDVTAPSVSLTAPASGATVSGETVELTATASDGVAVAGVKFYINGALLGSEDTTSAYSTTWDSTQVSNGSVTIAAAARDTSNNYATSTITVTVANTGVTPVSVAATVGTSTAVITWTTTTAASSQVRFGLTSTYSTSTPVFDVVSRVTSHSVTLRRLPQCTLFNYAVSGTSSGGLSATSSNATFRTAGCTGSASINGSESGYVPRNAGGSVNYGRMTLTVPANFTSATTSSVFQIHDINYSSFFDEAGGPTAKTRAGNYVYTLKALSDATTTISSFDEDLTVSMTYVDAEISGVQEDTLWMYRYDGTTWNALTNCVVDETANTVTCETTQFSDFALFGDEDESTQSSSSTSVNGSSSRGGSVRDRVQTLAARGLTAQADLLRAQYSWLFSASQNMMQTASPVYAVFATSSSAAAVAVPTRNLEKGMMGTDVKNLQLILIALKTGMQSAALEAHGATGYFGPLTKNALAEYQATQGITPAIGYFGPKTRAFMNVR